MIIARYSKRAVFLCRDRVLGKCGTGLTDSALTPPGESDLDRIETILVVEDEAEVRRVICLTLELQGYRVLAAEGAEQALRLSAVEGGSIDLLLADVILPGMSGPRLYEKLRMTCENLRVLFISGYAGDVLATHGLSDADAPFLAKPFSPATLSRKLRQLLRSGPLRPHYHGRRADRRSVD